MKKSVAITISDERLAALEMYLEQKNIPQNVRNFIEMKSEKKPAKKSRNSLPAETEKLSEQ